MSAYTFVIHDALRTTVQWFVSEDNILKGALESLETERNEVQASYDVHYALMNRRERYFGGWFGGDKKKVEKASSLRKDLRDIDIKISDSKRDLKAREEQLYHTIKTTLISNDPCFKSLSEILDKVTSVRGVTENYLDKIESALSDISSAQTTETLDLFSDNDAISFMSSMNNSSAQSAIDSVKGATPGFQKALTEYGGFMRGVSVSTEFTDVSDTFDLILDFALDGGIDFMSFLALSSLSSAESELSNLKTEVLKAKSNIDGAYQKAKSRVDKYIESILKRCID